MTAPKATVISQAEATVGHVFATPGLLIQALTHTSATNETGQPSNERLEFLGDAVLDLVVAQWLYSAFPDASEGTLSKLRARVVNEAALAARARAIGLGPHLVLGRGEDRDGGREKDMVLADALEAVLGAAYLDAGLTAAAALVDAWFGGELAALSLAHARDPKSALQEWVQRHFRATPTYALVSQAGPVHARVFVVAVSWQGTVRGTGQGATKKAAEMAAAAQALAATDPEAQAAR